MTDRSDPGGGAGASDSDREKLMHALIVVMQSWNRCRACGMENDDEHDAELHAFDAPTDDEVVTLFLEEIHGVGLDVSAGGPPVPARPQDDEREHLLREGFRHLEMAIKAHFVSGTTGDIDPAVAHAYLLFRRVFPSEIHAAARPGEEPPDAR